MTDRRNALLWAIGWWIVRRQLRRRAAVALAGATGAATVPRRGRRIVGVAVLAALVAGAVVAARRLGCSGPRLAAGPGVQGAGDTHPA
jgi:hypothetical protein